MAEHRPSRQELNRRKRQGEFVGRQAELSIFREIFARDPEDAPFLFHVHGIAGVGKTSLVKYWESLAIEHQAMTAYVDDDANSALEAMEAISLQFGRHGRPLKAFDRLAAKYRQQHQKAEAAVAGQTPRVSAETEQNSSASTLTTVATHAALALTTNLVPGLGAVTGEIDRKQAAEEVERLRKRLGARLRSREDVQLVMQPLQALTPVFLEELAKVARSRPRVVIFFDTYERTAPVLDHWLSEILMGEDYGELPANVVVVLCGQGRLDARYWGDYLKFVREVPLKEFTEYEARVLLADKGIVDEQVVEMMLRLSGRLPVLVDTLAETRPNDFTDIGDPSETAVERFLKWETGWNHRAAALACALPLQLDEDIYRAIAPEEASNEYAWLRRLPFVNDQAGRCRYHGVVRAPMLRLQRTKSPSQWRTQQTTLADAFRQWRRALEEPLDPEERWGNVAWREHLLSETYHRLCADPHRAWPEALGETVHACDQGVATLRRWAQMLVQAGEDTDSAKLTDWGQRLEKAAEESTGRAVDLLLRTDELGPVERALTYTIRAREHLEASRAEAAMNDYRAALALNPDLVRAYSGRGASLRAMRRYEEAVADYTRAIELDPNQVWLLAIRGETYQDMGRYEEAVPDFTRAIELDPNRVWLWAVRGVSYQAMERYEDAVGDYTRAIELDPNECWSRYVRGVLYKAMGRYEEAVADYTRAVELDGDHASIIIGRGETHQAMGLYDEAVADFTRAVELDPDQPRALAGRGASYLAMERHEEAVADYTRAIELDPDQPLALAGRGVSYQTTGRYEDAVADYTRSLELDPDQPRVLAVRGDTYRSMERHEEAAADYTRSLELDPDQPLALAGRGVSYQTTGRYEDAVADYTRSLELDPDQPRVLAVRGDTYRSMERHEEAAADYTRSLELDPDQPLALAGRGVSYQTTGRYEDAVADYTRSLELDPDQPRVLAVRGDTYRSMERHEEAAADYTRSLELDPDQPLALAFRGDTYRSMERHEEAAADYTRSLELDPDQPLALAFRGASYLAMERHEEAAADFTRSIELDPDQPRVLAVRGDTYRSMERHEEAAADYTRAVELDPDNAYPLAGRGASYQAMERHEEAVADYTRSIELDPDQPRVLAVRGASYLVMDRHEDAVADFTRAVELDPDQPLALTYRGASYQATGRYEKAVADYTRAVELDRNEPLALAGRGDTYRLMGRYEDAVADYTRAIELDPDNAYAFAGRAGTHRILGRYADAQQDLDGAASAASSHPRSALEAAMLSSAADGPVRARSQWEALDDISDSFSKHFTKSDCAVLRLVICCALEDWSGADAALLKVLANPRRGTMDEAVEHLTQLSQAPGFDAPQLDCYRERLAHA
ncbi:tetratricopeptide repeat protein [Streptomyces sp. NBC_01310]|uniref:ATP-binding protein n=1 Tax=Streptomyces sp. NBC_01310 TaxID=2903820 RepID=UPI0035B5E939|nr:tetratricopeptide repeat protein [Streptomyces sp. NBC_01310]